MSHTSADTPTILIESIEGATVVLPARATAGSSGYDICADESLEIPAGEYAKVRTGLKMSIPAGYEAQVRPRSGLAVKFGIGILNAPGTIDSDYRGEVCVILINHGREVFKVEQGMRIAQLVFSQVINVTFRTVDFLDSSMRGEGGFGSSGK